MRVSRGALGWAGLGFMVVGRLGLGGRREAQRRLVTLRFAGRDRMTVSGRELPRTSDASLRMVVRYRIDPASRFLTGSRRPPSPRVVVPRHVLVVFQAARASLWVSGLSWERCERRRLTGHGGPEEAAEFAGDGGGGDVLPARVDSSGRDVLVIFPGLPHLGGVL